MNPRSAAVLALVATCLLAGARAQPDVVPLKFDRLDLNDGRKLKNVVVKSYDAKSQRLLIIADGKAMMIPVASVPAPFNEKLKDVPASGGFVSTTSAPRQAVKVITAADQYGITTPAPALPPYVNPSYRPAPRPVHREPASPEASLAEHQNSARARAFRYYRYEYPAGSSSIRVTALDFELGVPQPVPGWTGRCCTEGKAFLEFFDSKGRSLQRATSTFEVITEQKPNEALKVVDFSRKT